MNVRSAPGAYELVPLADRVRAMRLFRLVAAVLVLAAAVALPGLRDEPIVPVVLATAAWLAVSLAGEAVWHLAAGRALPLFGALLIADGFYLAWVSYVLVDEASPLRYLIVLHLMTVALLASFRTGLKLALWHSLLLLAAFHAQEAGLLGGGGAPVAVGDDRYVALLAYIVAFWVAAVATAAFAAVNERELRRRRFDLEGLGGLSLRLDAGGDGTAVGTELVRTVADDFGFARVALFAAPDGVLAPFAAHGVALPAEPPAAAPGGVLATALGAPEPLLVSRFAADDDPLLAAVLPGAANLAAVPLQTDGRGVGVLVCEHGLRRGSRIERRVVSMLARYASHAALALTNAWLLARLERSASTDGLTGVANRRMFDETLAREVARATRSGDRLSLLMLDVDHFKRLNDTYGHQAGDEALQAVAASLADSVRLGDLVARYGGEEFAVLLPGLDGEHAMQAAERLRGVVAGSGTEAPVTVSAGVATYPDDARDPLTLVEAADAALYASKRAGRDRSSRAAAA